MFASSNVGSAFVPVDDMDDRDMAQEIKTPFGTGTLDPAAITSPDMEGKRYTIIITVNGKKRYLTIKSILF